MQPGFQQAGGEQPWEVEPEAAVPSDQHPFSGNRARGLGLRTGLQEGLVWVG